MAYGDHVMPPSPVAASTAAETIRAICREVESAAFDAYGQWYLDSLPYPRDYEFYLMHRIYGGTPRKETGIATRHGVVNTIHPDNEHAAAVRRGPTVLPDIELWRDGSCRAYRDDYFFDVVAYDGTEEVGRVHCVLQSPSLTACCELLGGGGTSSE